MNAVTEWEAGEVAALRLFNQWSREQALAIAAWDAASVRGAAVGPRPIAVNALALQAKARAEA